MQSRAIKRRDNALRQIKRWRDGLGAKARRLSDKFIAEEALAESYCAGSSLSYAECVERAGEAAPPLGPVGDVANIVPALPTSQETATDIAPALPLSDATAGDIAPAVVPTSEATAANLAPAVPTSEATAAEIAPTVPTLEATAAGFAPAVPTSEEITADVAPAVPVSAKAAKTPPLRTPAGDESINWVGWLTGKDRYEWYRVSNAACKDFKQLSTSKRWLVQHLVLDRKVIRPDQVCPELAQLIPAIVEAAPTVAASVEAPQ